MNARAHGNTAAADVSFRNRLAVRQAGPIVSTLACLLGVLLATGYFFARDEALKGVQRQTAQLADSISNYDVHYRSWFAASAAPLVRIFEAMGPALPPVQSFNDTELGRKTSQMLGQRELIVRTVDEHGIYRTRRWSQAPIVPDGNENGAEDAGQTQTRLEATLAAIGGSPGWHAPSEDEAGLEREQRIRYSVPLHRPDQEKIFGVLTLTVAMSWFEERIKAVRSLDGCAVFMLYPDGRWTLPQALIRGGFEKDLAGSNGPALERLKADMRKQKSGSMALRLGNEPFMAVYVPLSMKDFTLGALIPRAKLLGTLDSATILICLVGAVLFFLALFSLHRTALTMLRPLEPLKNLAERLAQGNVSTAGPPRTAAVFPYPDEPGRLARTADLLRHALVTRARDLTLLAVTRERLQGELKLARAIQEGLLPAAMPETDYVATSACLEPARDVSGDAYDCFFINPDTLCCLVGGAAGRGVPAALLMGRVMPLLRELLHSGLSPAQALENVNQVVTGYMPMPEKDTSLFVTAFAGLFQRDAGRLLWASAGQRPPFTSWGENLPWSEDVPLGLRANAAYRERETAVPAGGMLLFCNERLLAAPNAAGEMFGEERLHALLREKSDTPATLLRALKNSVLRHCGERPHEGLAMLAILRKGMRA